MAQLRFPRPQRTLPDVRYVRAPEPLHFPEEAEMPEGKTHLTLRTFLYQLLHFALGKEHSVGSDQFVYWNAANPQRCLAPDTFVKLGVPDEQFGSWKTWERGGVPELAVEIVSPTETDGISLTEKIGRYFECGVHELVRFDPIAAEGRRLRVWDRVDGDFVERIIADDRTPCVTLGLNWVVCPVENEPVGLRLIDDEGRLLETRLERVEAARAEEHRLAETRIRELEAELAKRGSGS